MSVSAIDPGQEALSEERAENLGEMVYEAGHGAAAALHDGIHGGLDRALRPYHHPEAVGDLPQIWSQRYQRGVNRTEIAQVTLTPLPRSSMRIERE